MNDILPDNVAGFIHLGAQSDSDMFFFFAVFVSKHNTFTALPFAADLKTGIPMTLACTFSYKWLARVRQSSYKIYHRHASYFHENEQATGIAFGA